MKKILVEIEGTGMGLLMHNPSGMTPNTSGKKQIPTAEEEAASSCYWLDDKSSLCYPGWNLFRCLVKGASGYKFGKKNGMRVIAASVMVEPAMLSFNTKEYSIDTRRAVIQRQGILRSRALLKNWKLKFELHINEEDISPQVFPTLRAIGEDAGRSVGLGDFRPERNGPFGKFKIINWQVL